MRSTLRLLLCLLAFVPLQSWSAFHLWQLSEVYSNADGSVQYVEMTALAGSQQFVGGQTLTAHDTGAQTHTFTFPSDLPGDTSGKKMLIATTGFAALGLVTPDYTLPNGFLFPAGGSVTFGGSGDTINHTALPGPAQSIDHGGTPGTPTPTNFTGKVGTISGSVVIGPNPIPFSGTSINTSSPPNIVKITNIHNAQITISSVTVTGDFAVLPVCTTLNPGASCQAGMYFNPTAQGVRNGTLTVASDAPGNPHTAPVSGTGEKSLVTHYYRSILRREPDAGGKQFWTDQATAMQGLGANINEAWFAMAQQFYFSAEYLALNRDDNGFVTDLYVTFFNRTPDAGGLNFWTNQIAQGVPREVILAAFEFSPEFANFTQAIFGNTAARAEVDAVMDFYRGLLSRLPDASGFNFWVTQFRQAQCQGAGPVNGAVESISFSFKSGAEYSGKNRTNAQYVGDLYNAFLRRGGDLGGVQFWINQLNTQAMTSEQVRQQFIGSTEFQARVNAIVNQGCLP